MLVIRLLESERFAALVAIVRRFARMKPSVFPEILFRRKQFLTNGAFVFLCFVSADVLLQMLVLFFETSITKSISSKNYITIKFTFLKVFSHNGHGRASDSVGLVGCEWSGSKGELGVDGWVFSWACFLPRLANFLSHWVHWCWAVPTPPCAIRRWRVKLAWAKNRNHNKNKNLHFFF